MSESETFDLPPWSEAVPGVPPDGAAHVPAGAGDDAGDRQQHRSDSILLVGSGSSDDTDLEHAAADAARRSIDDLAVQLEVRGLRDLTDVRVTLVRRKNVVAAIAVGRAVPLR